MSSVHKEPSPPPPTAPQPPVPLPLENSVISKTILIKYHLPNINVSCNAGYHHFSLRFLSHLWRRVCRIPVMLGDRATFRVDSEF
jgi:hypothetical protein